MPDGDAKDHGQRELPAGPDLLEQRSKTDARDPLSDEEEPVVVAPEVERLQEVRMGETHGEPRLVRDAHPHLRPLVERTVGHSSSTNPRKTKNARRIAR